MGRHLPPGEPAPGARNPRPLREVQSLLGTRCPSPCRPCRSPGTSRPAGTPRCGAACSRRPRPHLPEPLGQGLEQKPLFQLRQITSERLGPEPELPFGLGKALKGSLPRSGDPPRPERPALFSVSPSCGGGRGAPRARGGGGPALRPMADWAAPGEATSACDRSLARYMNALPLASCPRTSSRGWRWSVPRPGRRRSTA